jgi:hypothetical protein
MLHVVCCTMCQAAVMFGEALRMDVLTVDAIVDQEGQAHILEVNGTSSGFAPEEADEDNRAIRELVLAKLAEIEMAAAA